MGVGVEVGVTVEVASGVDVGVASAVIEGDGVEVIVAVSLGCDTGICVSIGGAVDEEGSDVSAGKTIDKVGEEIANSAACVDITSAVCGVGRLCVATRAVGVANDNC